MANPTENSLTDHEYDGIREFDNPCPGWWTWLFWGTFFFSIVYFIFFEFSLVGWTVEGAYDEAVAADIRRRYAEIGELEANEATMLEFMGKPDWLKSGEVVFGANCATCHGSNGAGLVGPNLTDDYYKNAKNLADIANVVINGAANGAMPAWRNRLSHQNDIVLVSCYVANMRGKNLPGRPPEGEIIPPWPPIPEPPAESKTPGDPAADPAAP